MKDSTKVCTDCYESLGYYKVEGECKQCQAEKTNCSTCKVVKNAANNNLEELECTLCVDGRDTANTDNYYLKTDKSCVAYPTNILTCKTKNDDATKLADCTC